MKKNILIFIGILFFVSSAHADFNQDSDGTVLTQVTPRIVGGRDAEQGEWPWIAELLDNQSFICGGSLIHPEWIITAAHCVEGKTTNSLDVVLGLHNRVTDEGQRFNLKKIISHPSYDSWTLDSDIALLQLENACYSYTPITLIRSNQSFAGEDVTVIGWGKTSEGGQSSDVLQEVTVPLVSNEVCDAAYPRDPVTENMICAGFSEGGKDACNGDSGGPLMIMDENVWKLLGLVSWGEGCAQPDYYGVYTNVPSLLDFIDKNLPCSILGKLSTSFAGHSDLSVKNADISLVGTDYKTKTDDTGSFIFNNIPPADYTISIRAQGLIPITEDISVNIGQEIILNKEMTPLPNGIAGDFNGNGKLGIEDAIGIIQELAGVE
ncbi:Coagulation factor VII [Candidatus Magnetomoraceae bacterium gMMP-15]